ncbi:hypothetical protein Z043_123004, partial [Scleropages formosus]
KSSYPKEHEALRAHRHASHRLGEAEERGPAKQREMKGTLNAENILSPVRSPPSSPSVSERVQFPPTAHARCLQADPIDPDGGPHFTLLYTRAQTEPPPRWRAQVVQTVISFCARGTKRHALPGRPPVSQGSRPAGFIFPLAASAACSSGPGVCGVTQVSVRSVARTHRRGLAGRLADEPHLSICCCGTRAGLCEWLPRRGEREAHQLGLSQGSAGTRQLSTDLGSTGVCGQPMGSRGRQAEDSSSSAREGKSSTQSCAVLCCAVLWAAYPPGQSLLHRHGERLRRILNHPALLTREVHGHEGVLRDAPLEGPDTLNLIHPAFKYMICMKVFLK